ncbi:MAG: hypothetical protein V1766_14540 [Pseudomonadota bacterium]
MKTKLIVMLTNNDQTVPDAIEVFDGCKNLPILFWGFKNIGLPVAQMKVLVDNIRNAGKTACLEVVSYSEKECMEAARLAAECRFDYLMGTLFYPAVFDFLKDKPIKYSPFCGKVSGNPSILEGSIKEIIAEGLKLQEVGVDAIDLLAYRHVDDPEGLAEAFIKALKIPVILAGSVDTFARIDRVEEMGAWGFTIGSAFFNKKFVPGGSFNQQAEAVIDYLQK